MYVCPSVFSFDYTNIKFDHMGRDVRLAGCLHVFPKLIAKRQLAGLLFVFLFGQLNYPAEAEAETLAQTHYKSSNCI